MKSNSVAAHFHFRPVARRFTWRAWRMGLAALALLPLAAVAQTITSAVPGFITYQGKVTNANGTLVGTGTPVNRTVIFRIWSHASNSTVNDLIYSEQQNVTISEGEFSVLVGQGTAVSGTPLGFGEGAKGPPSLTVASPAVFGGATRYLGVTIDDGSANADPEVSPRQQMVTTAFAFRSKYAESLGANGGSSLTVTDQGNVGIGITNPTFPLSLATTLGDKIGLFGGFNYGIGLQLSTVQIHGALSSDDIAFGYGSSASMTETVRFKGNGNVGIGTATPTAKLDVNGPINVFDGGFKSQYGGLVSEAGATMINFGMNDTRFGSQANSQQGGFLRLNTQSVSNLFQFYARPAGGTSAAEIVSITSAGNVGIGNASPSAKLHVNGSLTAGAVTASSLTLSGPLSVPGAATTHSQGAWLEWNKNSGLGQTFLLNQRGTGSGGIVFGEIDTGNTITERMSIDSGGNVGIGGAPGAKLDVYGGVRASGGSGYTFGSGGDLDGGLFSPADGVVTVRTNNAERVRVDSAGNVGIGTTSPVSTLDVRGASAAIIVGTSGGVDGTLYFGNSGHGVKRNYGGGTNNVGLWTTAGDVYLSGNGHQTNHLVVKNGGYVGIGITDPKAPLHVKRAESTTPNHTRKGGQDTTYGVYLSGNGALMYWDGASGNFGDNETISYNVLSAIFDGEVVARAGYWVGSTLTYSDVRAKTVLGSSDSTRDLSLLRELKIRDFTWIDRTVDDHRPHKKLLAQEVEQAFPQAVRRTPRPTAIPNIYQVAEKLEFNAERKELRLTVGKLHELKEGDSVDIATDETPMRQVKVTAVSGEREFTISCETAPKSVFVYGKYVTDFRAVDYDAIAMLNVSATQELARQVEALKASEERNAELVRRVAELEAKDRARDARLASIEKLLSSGQTVMARPASASRGNASGQE